jgi:hypothetical protein
MFAFRIVLIQSSRMSAQTNRAAGHCPVQSSGDPVSFWEKVERSARCGLVRSVMRFALSNPHPPSGHLLGLALPLVAGGKREPRGPISNVVKWFGNRAFLAKVGAQNSIFQVSGAGMLGFPWRREAADSIARAAASISASRPMPLPAVMDMTCRRDD